ncbi:MAG: universal stress protein [Bryobacteraceae bacterium]
MATTRFGRILFPVDFTPHCRAVAPVVAAWAERFDATVTLLHATDLPPGAYADWYAFMNLMDVERYRQHARSQLHHFLAETFGTVPVERGLAEGAAGPAIVDYARTHHIDLIMMPTRGLNRFRTLLLGGVTAHVLHDAECPVWTEAHLESEEKLPLACRTVICAIDLGPASERTLQVAAAVAGRFQSEIRVVHACSDSEPERAKALAAYEKLAAAAGVGGRLEMLEGGPAQAVASAAAAHGADLVVIGRGRVHETLGRLRDHAHAIIRTSPCPVLSV